MKSIEAMKSVLLSVAVLGAAFVLAACAGKRATKSAASSGAQPESLAACRAKNQKAYDEVLARVATRGRLEPAAGPARGNGPAVYHRLVGAPGTVGVITPMTHTYCGDCNRVRLTADGRLRTCLYGDHEVNLRDPLRAGAPLGPLFVKALAEKPQEHHLLQMQVGGLKALSQVGG